MFSRILVAYLRHMPLERGKWRLLHATAGFLVVQVEPGLWMRITDPDDYMEKRAVYGQFEQEGLFEREEVEQFLSLAKPGMTFFDVGANIGWYSLLAANRVGPNGRVHAFEPTPKLVCKLKTQLELNAFRNVTVNELAVSDHRGTARFFLHETDFLSSFAAVSDRAVTVPTVTLDEYIDANRINRVDLMKIDVEGAEALVLAGAEKLLSGGHAPVIMMEVNPPLLEMMGTTSENILVTLQRHGYEVSTLAEHEGYRNVLARKPNAH
jgi:FkbM family methyltransferase